MHGQLPILLGVGSVVGALVSYLVALGEFEAVADAAGSAGKKRHSSRAVR